MRCELGALKLILLDEVSMVGNGMFTVQMNNRLKDLKGSQDNFGGASIITLGDLFQLKPVIDSYVPTDVQCLNCIIFLLQIYGESFLKCLSWMKLCVKEKAKCLLRSLIDFVKVIIHPVIFKNSGKTC